MISDLTIVKESLAADVVPSHLIFTSGFGRLIDPSLLVLSPSISFKQYIGIDCKQCTGVIPDSQFEKQLHLGQAILRLRTTFEGSL
jgi:hypothetical protein